MAKNQVELYESKLKRTSRYLKRQTDEATALLGQNVTDISDKASTIDQIDLLVSGIEHESEAIEKLNDAYESECVKSTDGQTADQARLAEEMADGVYDAKMQIRRLLQLKRKLQQPDVTLSRPESQYSFRSVDRTQDEASQNDDASQSGAMSQAHQSGNDYDAAVGDRHVSGVFNHEEQPFGETNPASAGGTTPAAQPTNDESVRFIDLNQSSAVPNATGQMTNETIQMLCQTMMLQLTAAQQRNESGDGGSSLKLPKHNLPKFSKGPEKWQSFWDQFEKSVDQQRNLAKVQKMQYLKGCLEGDAKKLVEGLPLSNDNYDVAVGLLKDRFGNPSAAIERIYAKLIDLPTVPSKDCRKLRDFCFEIENCLRQLEALGADSKSDHLVGIVLRKLPRYLVLQLERGKGPRQQWTMQVLRSLLADELEIEEATFMRNERSDDGDRNKNGPFNRGNRNGNRNTTDGFAANDSKYGRNRNGGSNGPPKCVFCGEAHWSGDCKKYSTCEKRKEIVKKLRRCFLCLDSQHSARDCKSEKPCFHCKRARLHHSSLCPEKFPSSTRGPPDSARKANDGNTQDLTEPQDIGGLASDEYSIMKTATCDVLNPDDSSQRAAGVRVFLDSGTSRSWMTVARAKQLKLKLGRKKRLMINRFADDGEPKSIEMQEAKVTLETRTGHKVKIAVAVTSRALGSIVKTGSSEIKRHIPMGLELADDIPCKDTKVCIDIMIGNDYYDDLVYYDRVSLQPGLWLINSAFGWVLSGRTSDLTYRRSRSETGMFVLPSYEVEFPEMPDEDDIRQAVRSKDIQIENLWNLETIGIKDEPNEITDDIAIEQFNKSVRFEDGRYMVTWPYMQNADSLPKNDDIALRRLKSMLIRLQKQEKFDFLQKYDAIIQDQKENGVIEEVLPDEIDSDNRVHYLAHHGVEKPDSATTKIRIVYNASYRRDPDSPSLNDCLYRGQVFMESLIILLIRFRLNPIALIGDLEKAFLKVGLQLSERDVTRFYWVRDIRKPAIGDNIVIYRFTRVSFGVKSSPFLLGATVAYHLKQQQSETARKVERDLYVDNLVTGCDTIGEAKQLYYESKEIFQAANMNIRDFGSNDDRFNEMIPEEDTAMRNPVKVLGMVWDKKADTFASRPYRCRDVVCWSKKSVLSVLFQIYDPLGLVCPVVLPGKILLQQMNKRGLHWDEKLPPEIEKEWQKILVELNAIGEIKVSRYLEFKLEECSRIMVFCDASADAYAAVVYMQKSDGRSSKSHLIFAKSRVSPLKGMTIPRLELMAVVLGVRVLKFLRQNLPFEGKAVLLSDSQCVLRWIPDHTVTGVFIQNRLREIRKAENVQFRYVPTKENPADIASRGCLANELSPFWWHGPSWAAKPESEWPTWEGNVERVIPAKQDEEIVEEAFAIEDIEECKSPFGIDVEAYSSYKRLIRVTAYCARFVQAARVKNRADSLVLSPEEQRNAVKQWIKFSQSVGYRDVIEAMQKCKRNTTQQQLGIQADDEGILRCHGRLSLMSTEDDTKFPILLPKNSKLTELIVKDCHERSMHAGTAQTLAAVRQEFWIPHGRARVRNLVKKCTTCRYFEGKPFGRPEMPELPTARVTRDRPFRNVGLDYFGPLYTKSEEIEHKRWVCLITCLTTRAIHLELVNDLSADEFLMALRRFMARRGKCDSIVSDNATQFKAVHKSNVINETLAGQSISWKFIPEMAPWSGGVYERLVRSVKSAMKKSLRRVLLTDIQLQTVLSEVENCVNSRPLTYQTDDINSWKVISPNDLLGIPPVTTIPTDSANRSDPAYKSGPESSRDRLIKLHKAQMNQLEEVWNVWQNDYLLNMRERMHYGHKDTHGKIQREPKLGEVVVVKDEKLSRGKWKLGKIQQHRVSQDGKVRAVKLRMSNGHILIRPVNLLHPVELDATDNRNDVSDEEFIRDCDPPRRPKRAAARKAEEKFREILKNESDENESDTDSSSSISVG